MMNYRHAFHAGNFADVFKHIILCRIVLYLMRKRKAFRVIDTFSGIGLYNLSGEQAGKTGEWRDGIARLLGAELPRKVSELLTPYLSVVQHYNQSDLTDGLLYYPGSPVFVRRLFRNQDRLTAIELHDEDFTKLKQQFAGDFQVKTLNLDGWLAFKAQLPPKEKRGLVLIDPPFEVPGEFDRMIDNLTHGLKRWPGGTYALWYPLKDDAAAARYQDRLRKFESQEILDCRITIKPSATPPVLYGCGMIIINPPYTLHQEMAAIGPFLATTLGLGAEGYEQQWLAGSD